MRTFIVAWITMVLAASSSVSAQPAREPIDVASRGPQVGELIPDFSLADQNGRVWTRESIMGPNGAMIMFHRSADW